MLASLAPLLLGAALATAAPTPETTTEITDPHWEGVYRRATRVGHAGVITNWAGTGLMLTGTGLLFLTDYDNQDAYAILWTGAGVGLVGTPLAAGGALRARKAVVQMGHRAPVATYGAAAWPLMLPSFLLIGGGGTVIFIHFGFGERQEKVAVPLLAGVGALAATHGGAAALAQVQMRQNRRALEGLTVVPRWSEGKPGLALVGRW